MNSVLPAPNLLGAPERYDTWRPRQDEAVLSIVDSTKRFVVVCAPTAFGKTLMYVTAAILTDVRAAFLTATTALQAQIGREHAEIGMVEIKGLNRYDCLEGLPTGRFGDMRRDGWKADRGLPMSCDEAPCQSGAFCPRRTGGCLYYDAFARAASPVTRLITPNYAYWMSINKYADGGLGHIDMLVLDEAHQAMDELTSFIGTEFRRTDLASHFPDGHLPAPTTNQMGWVKWAAGWRTKALYELEVIKGQIRDAEKGVGKRLTHAMLRKVRDLKQLGRKLETIAFMRGEWVIEWTTDDHQHQVVKFNPVQPSEYAEGSLFLGVRKVVMVSAVARPEMATKLGAKAEDIDFREYPSPIPRERRPVVYCPVVHMNRNSAAAGKDDLHRAINQIIDRRPDRKGIIHTVSYPRMREVYAESHHKERILVHDPSTTADTIERFKKSTKPLILVSPVVYTGYDFPNDEARWQLLIKVPFPVMVDEILKARAKRDPGYKDYVTMVSLVQAAGRIVRLPTDWGETIIVDADFGWWYFGRGRLIVPKWFAESVRCEQLLGSAMVPPKEAA